MYKVLIKGYGSDEVVKTVECGSERKADKVDDGIMALMSILTMSDSIQL